MCASLYFPLVQHPALGGPPLCRKSANEIRAQLQVTGLPAKAKEMRPTVMRSKEYRTKKSGWYRFSVLKRTSVVLGAVIAVVVFLSITNRKDDWTEACSDYEVNQGTAGERFDPFHLALTQGRYSRVALSRLRQAVWQDLPLCRDLVELASLSLQLYNDLLFADAAPEQSKGIPDLKQYERWYELFLRLHEK